MDSLEGMNLLNENIIDLTITSPPYNIGKEYENILKIEDYIKWTKNWINNVFIKFISLDSFSMVETKANISLIVSIICFCSRIGAIGINNLSKLPLFIMGKVVAAERAIICDCS